MGVIKDQFGATITLGKQLGRGGEGSVHEVLGESRSVAKLFYDEKLAYYEPRLVEMIPNPPRDQTRSMTPPHISIAWPERILRENKKFIGYIMPRIQMAPDIYKVYSPRIRRSEFPNFDWRYLHHTALNLAIAVHAYHAAGYVIGDLNSKNVLVNRDAMVTMVDADSIQVKTSTGKVMRCPVGTPDFTPPELQGIKLDSVDRTEYHDAFALAVMIFLLVMEGTHPFSGAPKDPSTSVAGPVYQYCIKNGIFPYRPQPPVQTAGRRAGVSGAQPGTAEAVPALFCRRFQGPAQAAIANGMDQDAAKSRDADETVQSGRWALVFEPLAHLPVVQARQIHCGALCCTPQNYHCQGGGPPGAANAGKHPPGSFQTRGGCCAGSPRSTCQEISLVDADLYYPGGAVSVHQGRYCPGAQDQ